MPSAPAIARPVRSLSPVSITVSTPNPRSAAIPALASSLGSSRIAISPSGAPSTSTTTTVLPSASSASAQAAASAARPGRPRWHGAGCRLRPAARRHWPPPPAPERPARPMPADAIPRSFAAAVIARASGCDEVGHAQPALGQGAGLVERHRAGSADRLQRGAALHQQSAPGARGQAGRHRRRDRDHQRAGTGDQQQREAVVGPGPPVSVEQQRRCEHDQQCRCQGDRRPPSGEPLDEALRGRPRGRSLLDQEHDTSHGVIGGVTRHAHAQPPIGIDRSGDHLLAGAARDGHALAGHRTLVQCGTPFDDLAVAGHAVSRPHLNQVADAELGGGYLLDRAALACTTLATPRSDIGWAVAFTPSFDSRRNTGPDAMPAAASHSSRRATGRIRRPSGTAISAPRPSWSLLLRRTVTR